MPTDIETIKKEFEGKFTVRHADLGLIFNSYAFQDEVEFGKEIAFTVEELWNFIETKLNETRKQSFAEGTQHAVGKEITRLAKQQIREETLKDFIEYYKKEVIPEAVIEDIDFIPENVEYSCGQADTAFAKHLKEIVQTYLTTKEGE